MTKVLQTTTLCSHCGKQKPEDRFRRCPHCRAVGAASQAVWRARQTDNGAGYQREFHRRRRENVLAHYGGLCSCCGEDSFEFLALDHIAGGGEKHRAEVGQGSNMIGWVLANNYPPIFRVLCHNCNQAMGYYGVCPHERELRLVVGGGEDAVANA